MSMCMSSVNISLNQTAYERLLRLKRKEESFSQVVVRLSDEKDISRCFGLLANDDLQDVRAEAERVRKETWRADKA